jgi:hypothetical protein
MTAGSPRTLQTYAFVLTYFILSKQKSKLALNQAAAPCRYAIVAYKQR